VVGLVGGALVACTSERDYAEDVAVLLDTADALEAEAGLMMTLTQGTSANASDEQIVAALATDVVARMQPAGCATVTQHDLELTITFDECSGTRGLARVSGTVVLL